MSTDLTTDHERRDAALQHAAIHAGVPAADHALTVAPPFLEELPGS